MTYLSNEWKEAQLANGKFDALVQRVLAFLRRERLCRAGQRVLLACSGGADSSALFELLWRLRSPLGISLGVVMVDHRQCPDFARAVRLIRGRCRRRRVPLIELRAEGARPGLSETELRRLRYRLLAQAAREGRYQLVATGHTREDQVETMLLRLLRGTGVAGLAGIPPRRGIFIRPLLACGHGELVELLRRLRLGWWEDPSNRAAGVWRNRVRLQLLPLLRRWFNPALDEALLRLADSAARQLELSRWAARPLRPARREGRFIFSRRELVALPAAARELALRQAAARLHPEGAGVEQPRLDELLQMLQEGRRRFRVMLGGRRECYRRGEDIVVARLGKPAGFFARRVDRPQEITLPAARCRLRLRRCARRAAPTPGPHTACFDAAQVAFPLLVRSLRPGDRLEPWGQEGSHKVARLLMESKIPREERWRVPLLAEGDQILWVAGVRRSRLAPVTSATRRVLVAELLPLG